MPTTRRRAVRGVPSGDATVTRTVSPIRAPVPRMVATPSAISPSPEGSRPSTADSSTVPLTGVAASARTPILLTVIAGAVARVIRSIAGSRFSSVSSLSVGTAPGPEDWKYAWNGAP